MKAEQANIPWEEREAPSSEGLPDGESFVGAVPETLAEAAKAVAEFDRLKARS